MNADINIEDLLDEFNAELGRRGLYCQLIVCGGFVMRKRYYELEERKTADLDNLTELKDEIRLAASTAGHRKLAAVSGIDEQYYWLNDRVREGLYLHEKLPKGWDQRSLREEPLFVGENLRVFPLPRLEMALSKLNALLGDLTGKPRKDKTRFKQDLHDLKKLGYSVDELAEFLGEFKRMVKWYKRWGLNKDKFLEKLKNLLE